jgi:cytochrome c553
MSRSRFVGWMASVALTAAVVSFAAPAYAEGDAAHGKVLAYTCLGCHGIPNYKNVYPTYSVPELRGQHPEYIVAALKAYKSGERGHPTMHAHASTLSDQEMLDIAAYLGGEAIKTASAGAAPDPAGMPAAVATCAACHGHNGVGIMGIYPTLSGQHADYLEHSLTAYRTGARKNGIMAPFASQLKPEEIKQVAEYFAAQKPALQTVPRRENILRAKVN